MVNHSVVVDVCSGAARCPGGGAVLPNEIRALEPVLGRCRGYEEEKGLNKHHLWYWLLAECALRALLRTTSQRVVFGIKK
jgi:hypothetical protein